MRVDVSADSSNGGSSTNETFGFPHRSAFPMARRRPSPSPPQAQPDTSHADRLLEAIENEIVPRLILAHKVTTTDTTSCQASRPAPTRDEINEFARMAVRHDLNGALGVVEAMCRDGLSLESVLLDLVSAAARVLGDDWLDDSRSFIEVGAGLGTLQQVVHTLSPAHTPALPHRGAVLLVAAPGEQHTLGLYLLGELLRRAGFGVHIEPAMEPDDVVEFVLDAKPLMVGVSLSTDVRMSTAAELIRSIHSCAPQLPVLVGGALDLRKFAQEHGAAASFSDPREAVRWLETRVPRLLGDGKPS